VVAQPEVLVQLRKAQHPDAEGFNVHRRQHRSIRFGKDVEIRRSHQAAACRKRCVEEPRKPRRLLILRRDDETDSVRTRNGEEPGHGVGESGIIEQGVVR
jgi:hypothetical protein